MDNQYLKVIESDLTKLGLYQIFGGIIGIIMLAWTIYDSQILTSQSVILCLVVFLLFVYSIYCGTICLKITSNALVHSLTNQILQVIGFGILGFAFNYKAGIYLMVGLDLTNSIEFNLDFGFYNFDLSFNSSNQKLEIDFNLIAFLLIYWIDKLMNRVKSQELINKVWKIGE